MAQVVLTVWRGKNSANLISGLANSRFRQRDRKGRFVTPSEIHVKFSKIMSTESLDPFNEGGRYSEIMFSFSSQTIFFPLNRAVNYLGPTIKAYSRNST